MKLCRYANPVIAGAALLFGSIGSSGAATQANCVEEVTLRSSAAYENPFMEIALDVVVRQPDGTELRVPGFWAGGDDWCFRYASDKLGTHSWRTECSDPKNAGLHGVTGTIEVVRYTGDNPLLRHGFPRVAEDRRHFAYADGTPFFWLGDTWWKNLCKRLTWEGFQELAADRRKKGFSVIQIVCGPYPDEGPFKPSWENEGGMPYLTRDFTVLNPDYWRYADRRLKHLVDSGMVPAIVGAWGRADCDAMKQVGVDGLKRHWRYLIARYGAYPVFWILAGELQDNSKWGQGPWGEVGRYVRSIDPYRHPITVHTGGGRRGNPEDDLIIDFDMVGGSHRQDDAIGSAIGTFTTAYAKAPAMPTLVGETCYEGHMQTGFQYVQRHIFWQYMLSGAAGHTYGAAGVWHAGVPGDHGNWGAWGGQPYDWTTWREGMNYPGATQIGLGRKLLEEYPWQRFEPHPEWAEKGSFAAGIPGEVRFIYQPRRTIYNWKGTVVKQLETDVAWSAFYFDPATGRRFDQGRVKFGAVPAGATAGRKAATADYTAPNLPSPQDWVLVLEHVTTDRKDNAAVPEGRWPADKAWEWYRARPWPCGFNYVPANAISYTEMWMPYNFDAKWIDGELVLARDVGFNCLRVVLPFVVWEHDPAAFKKRLRTFLSVCDKHGIKVMFCLFDDCCEEKLKDPWYGKQPEVLKGWYANGWTASPGHSLVRNPEQWPRLERYVTDLIGSFKDDKRVWVWDLYNEPTNGGLGNSSLPLLTKVFSWARAIGPTQPLTVAKWNGNKELNAIIFDNSDIVTFHNYGDADKIADMIKSLKSHGRPIINTEWLNRPGGSLVETCLPVFARENVGCMNWGLVNGRTQTHLPWGHRPGDPEPEYWQHDLFHRDHQPYNVKELECFRRTIRQHVK